MPSFNSGRFLEAALESLLTQSRVPDEIVIQDGGSTDHTIDILARQGPPVSWISEPDRGQSDALNRARRRATGDLIGWLNADDLYVPNAIETALRVAADRPATDLIIGNFDLIDEDGAPIRHFTSAPFDAKRVRRHGAYLWSGATFITRRMMDRVGDFDEGLHYCMDLDYWLRLPADLQSVHIPVVLGQLRNHPAAKSSRARFGFLREGLRVNLRHSGGDPRETARVLARTAIGATVLATAPIRYSSLYSRLRKRRRI
jgi:glycosyltransferase involved in cell wall biosynthesis